MPEALLIRDVQAGPISAMRHTRVDIGSRLFVGHVAAAIQRRHGGHPPHSIFFHADLHRLR